MSAEEDDSEEDPSCTGIPEVGKAVRVTVLGLPGEIVPGSGWKNLTLRVANTSDRLMTRVDASLHKAMYSASGELSELEPLLSLEWYDQSTGTWKSPETYPHGQDFELADLAPGAHVDLRIRISVAPQMPTGSEGTLGVAAKYRDENGICQIAGSESGFGMTYFDFTVVSPADDPGGDTPDDQGDRPGPNLSDEPGGPAASDASLAHTGSNSAVRWLIGAGGASIALGSALALAVRKRRRHQA
ncbi:LPXTG cell wall anchor domain-containing protein [Streptomyces sp. CH-036]|uniref:LPXTG cell wall anchor domain-containing protein n=1 Tax=Streptomyces sp. CH-036 TaxID=3406733 RepID=UPI003C749976